MEVRKGNIMVVNIDIDIVEGELSVDRTNIKKHVDSVINSGVVIASGVEDIAVGDVVGYSKYDGVNVRYKGEKYILLSSRETQATVICKDMTKVRFGDHNREDSQEYIFKNDIIHTDTLRL